MTGVNWLRQEVAFRLLRDALAASSKREAAFRVVHFSVQPDHVHLLVEASDRAALSRGMRSLAIRVARAINAALGRRGRLWGDRYNRRDLTSPREVRNCLAYVLTNFKKHVRDAQGLDPCSSAPSFDGWRDAGPPDRVLQSAIGPPRTWLASKGWRRYGLLSIHEAPRSG
jgi:putative transposase